MPQLWQKWLMMSAQTGGLLRSRRHGIAPTDAYAASRFKFRAWPESGSRNEGGVGKAQGLPALLYLHLAIQSAHWRHDSGSKLECMYNWATLEA